MRVSYLFILAPLLLTQPAFAQDSDRVEQLEQDVMLLKRKLDRVSASGGSSSAHAPASDGGVNNAQTDVRISSLEEEIRSLRGKLEEKDFETRRVSEELEKLKKDMEFRLTELEKRPVAVPAADIPSDIPDEKPTEKPKAPTTDSKKKAELSVKEVPTEPEPAEADEAKEGETPRDHYNYAFRLLNQNQYEQAAKSFSQFTKKYPKDPLVGNAYYWQGETYYIRKDYGTAMDLFRQGYESMPKGPKAPDNLLKLGMSLASLKKKDEACVILGQVSEKYNTSSANTAAKAQAEMKRVGCE